MRSRLATNVLGLLLLLCSAASGAAGQACTGLCLQQVSCPGGGTTTLSGKVYAPNGIDPLPGVLVYIPNAAVGAFPSGVSCAVAGEPPSGSPLVGSTTAVDGSFTLTNVPVGNSIPLVVQSGRWRRQVVVPAISACTDTSFSASFPQNQSQGDIPRIAVVTGAYDAVECVLRKVGLADTEFTNPGGPGRVNLFTATDGPGAQIDSGTPTGDVLLASAPALSVYDVLMLPCEGAPYGKQSAQLTNLVGYANAGGRVYASHYSYDWLYQNAPFDTVVNWQPQQAALPDGIATVDTTFAQGQVLSQWLGDVGASTVPGQVAISTLRHDLTTVNPPTQVWLTLNDRGRNNPVMQFTFDTPVSATPGNSPASSCGRVLFNEYHVENPVRGTGKAFFPGECTSGPMTAQEKLLEFSLFDLTGSGNPPTLSPLTDNFGTVPVGSASGVQKFFWTNNTIFPVTVSSVAVNGDYTLIANGCRNLFVGQTCEIDVTFAPSATGTRPGTLSVTANTGTLSAALTGNAVTPLSVTAASLDFGKTDVGEPVSKTVTVTNVTAHPIALPPPAASGDFSSSSTCGATLPGGGSCTVTVTFTPRTTGSRTGTLNIGATTTGAAAAGATPALQTTLSGIGVDFLVAIGPSSAQTVAGLPANATSTTTPLAGFANGVTLACTTTAPASTCTLASDGFTPLNPVTDAVRITTTSQYTVVGYGSLGSLGGSGLHPLRSMFLALVAALSSLLLFRKRQSTGKLATLPRVLSLLFCGAAMSAFLTGCAGKDPAQNAPYTPAGSYTYTVSATDGFLRHSATYTLVVTAK